MNSDEPPTRRESGQLAAFEHTVREALTRLAPIMHDAEVEALAREARDLVSVFESWHQNPPIGMERTKVIERVLDLHRNVESMLAARRSP